MSYTCAPCQGANPVTVLLTKLQTGETDFACDTDLPFMLVGQLAIWLGIEPQGLYDAVKRHADREAKKAAAAVKAADGAGQGHIAPASEHPDELGADGCWCDSMAEHELARRPADGNGGQS